MRSPAALAVSAALVASAFLASHGSASGASGRVATYTAAQAAAGAKTFEAKCSQCHGAKLQGVTAPSLIGPGSGLSTSEVHDAYTFISTQMPAGNPGSLTTTEYVDVTAFIMNKNGHKPTSKPLTAAVAKVSTTMVNI